ncbi:MAG: DNA mismatch repair protein MutS [Thermodesulfobacteriota bacterium]
MTEISNAKMTPMVRQYLAIKEQYADAILFYRMGDFYEMFFEDAAVASGILEIALTSRNKNDDEAIPMCGIPVRAANAYIGRLIEQGHKVAVCEQTEDPKTAKGLVRREVVRVITPGMIIDNEFLDEKTNNYILAVHRVRQAVGLAFLDVSTGTFRVAESDNMDAIVEEALRINPREILLPQSFRDDAEAMALMGAFPDHFKSFPDEKNFAPHAAKRLLMDQFNTRSLEGFGCENALAAIGAAGALLAYVQETQKQKTGHILGLETYSLDQYLLIDETSCRNLELMGSLRSGSRRGTLLEILDQTLTAMGGRLFKQWLRYPLLDPAAIRLRLSAVAEIKQHADLRHGLREQLRQVFDLERLTGKITLGRANARDLTALKTSLWKIPDILASLATLSSELFVLSLPADQPDPRHLQELAGLIDAAIREDAPPTIHEGGIIKTGYHPELDELIQISTDGKSWLARLEADEKRKTGIGSLKVKYNKVFGYYIEVPRSQTESVPAHYVRKQTIANAERYVTEELKTFETNVLGAQERMAALEYRLFNEIRERVVENNHCILKVAAFTAQLDCLASLAEIADQNGYVQPDINHAGVIDITDGRHPVVEKLISGERYIPNSIRLDNDENQILVITGPNMAGKSTVLRQTALIVIMAQMGGFVPAAKASVCITDRIFTRVGALDNLSSGQSTFMVEMEETANIMNNAGADSLVIMDEIGRGTSTFDGLSIAWAVAEYLHDLKGCGVKTLFATHYHELTELARAKPRVKNCHIAVREWNDEIIFLRKLTPGSTNRSYGIQVARLAGLPESIIKKAKKVLARIENGDSVLSLAGDGSGDGDRAGKNKHSKKQVQLQLFRKPEEIIVDILKQLNISAMTPIEAINQLNELKQKANSVLN